MVNYYPLLITLHYISSHSRHHLSPDAPQGHSADTQPARRANNGAKIGRRSRLPAVVERDSIVGREQHRAGLWAGEDIGHSAAGQGSEDARGLPSSYLSLCNSIVLIRVCLSLPSHARRCLVIVVVCTGPTFEYLCVPHLPVAMSSHTPCWPTYGMLLYLLILTSL